MNEIQSQRDLPPDDYEEAIEAIYKYKEADIIDKVEFAGWKINRCTKFVVKELSRQRKNLVKSAEISANNGDCNKSNNILIRTSEISRIINLITNQKYELE